MEEKTGRPTRPDKLSIPEKEKKKIVTKNIQVTT